MGYFELACRLTREQARKALDQPCRCDAYEFPHRRFSGACTGGPYGTAHPADDRDEQILFDREEANAINRGLA